MNIPLHEFEQHIDETILKRGLQYYRKGLVQEMESTGGGQYEAIVEGTEDYQVQIEINNNMVTDFMCTCPYDYGPVCKHVVAVLFCLQQDELNLDEELSRKKAKSAKQPKRKTTEQQVSEILELLPPDELKYYVAEQCMRSKPFSNTFLANFAYLITPDSRELYKKQISLLLKASADRQGFIDYNAARVVGTQVYTIIEQAEKLLESGRYITSIYMATAVLEEMVKALQYADDSNGDIGGCIESAMEVLYSIVSSQINEEARKELFEYCTTAWDKEFFEGWDWHFNMLELASDLVLSKEEATHVHSRLDKIKPSGSERNWDLRKAQLIRLKLISRTEGQERAERFMEENISNSDIRKKVIENAIARNDYDKAISLCEKGILQDEKKYPGLADDWRNYLLKIYRQQNNTPQIIDSARYLFLKSHQQKESLFNILKKNVPSAEWKPFLDKIIQELSKTSHWGDNALVADIYIWEKRWRDLLEIVKKYPSLNNLENYEKYLVKDFPEEISEMYKIAILKYMERNLGRNHYKQVCRYLRKMKKMGAKAKANETIVELKNLYPQRRALLEELANV